MPDCYHIVSSRPDETGRDIHACVGTVGGPGRVHEMKTDGSKVHSRVRYPTRPAAEQHLDRLTRCFESKGHTVHRAEVIEDDADVGMGGMQPVPD